MAMLLFSLVQAALGARKSRVFPLQSEFPGAAIGEWASKALRKEMELGRGWGRGSVSEILAV